MKKYILATLAFCFSFSANGQTIPIDSFYVPGATWTEAVYFTNRPWIPPRSWGAEGKVFRIERDTLVSSVNYHVVSKMDAGRYLYSAYTTSSGGFDTFFSSDPPSNIYETIGRIRVDSNRVYFTRDINNVMYMGFSNFQFGVEYLIYDFNIGVGASVPYLNPMTSPSPNPAIHVDSIDSVSLLPGRNVAKYYDSLASGNYWLTGIGSSQGFLRQYQTLIVAESTYYYYGQNFTLCYSNPSLSLSYQFPYSDSILIRNLQRTCFNLEELDINEPKIAWSELIIYPNPTTTDYFSVEGIKLELVKEVIVSDVAGKTMSLMHHPFSTGKTSIHIPHEPGVYIARFEFEDGSVATRRVNKL